MARDSAAPILLVEDEAMIAMLVVMDLEDAGFAVVTAGDTETAIALLEAKGADFRALVTDVNFVIDRPTGWDIARRARELRRDLPVIYVSGASGHEWRENGVPGSRMLGKPFAAGEIVRTVTALLAGLG